MTKMIELLGQLKIQYTMDVKAAAELQAAGQFTLDPDVDIGRICLGNAGPGCLTSMKRSAGIRMHMMIPFELNTACGMDMTRRVFLGRTSGGLGLAALTGFLQSKTTANAAEGLLLKSRMGLISTAGRSGLFSFVWLADRLI